MLAAKMRNESSQTSAVVQINEHIYWSYMISRGLRQGWSIGFFIPCSKPLSARDIVKGWAQGLPHPLSGKNKIKINNKNTKIKNKLALPQKTVDQFRRCFGFWSGVPGDPKKQAPNFSCASFP